MKGGVLAGPKSDETFDAAPQLLQEICQFGAHGREFILTVGGLYPFARPFFDRITHCPVSFQTAYQNVCSMWRMVAARCDHRHHFITPFGAR